MKRFLLVLSLFFSLAAFAQNDTVRVSLTLPLEFHAHIYAFMQDRGGVEAGKYINQVVDAMVTPVNNKQLITVIVPFGFVKTLYLSIGSQQARLVEGPNKEIKLSLLQQLAGRPNLLQELSILADNSTHDYNTIIAAAMAELIARKQ